MAEGESNAPLPPLKVPVSKTNIDPATILGVVVSFALVIATMFLGGSPSAFVDVSSILIVVGGTFAITMASFSMGEIIGAQKVIFKAMLKQKRDPSDAANFGLQLAEIARRNGILALEQAISKMGNEKFLAQSLRMIVDGTPVADVERVMRQDLASMTERHQKGVSVLQKAAEFAPAMGLIGTLLGLVQMLGNLNDPTTIGPSMAIALLTTFYGAILSNMVFLPLASKLERNTEEELLIDKLYVITASSIGRRENPRRLETMLNAVLPPAKRIKYFK